MNKQIHNARTILNRERYREFLKLFFPLFFDLSFIQLFFNFFFFLNEKFLRIVALRMTSNRVIKLTPSYGMAALLLYSFPSFFVNGTKKSPRLFDTTITWRLSWSRAKLALERLDSVRSQGNIVLGRERCYIISFLYTITISRLDDHHLLRPSLF